MDTSVAYKGPSSNYGTANDPMVGSRIGGVNVFGGGLPLYATNKVIVGGVGLAATPPARITTLPGASATIWVSTTYWGLGEFPAMRTIQTTSFTTSSPTATALTVQAKTPQGLEAWGQVRLVSVIRSASRRRWPPVSYFRSPQAMIWATLHEP